MNRKTKAVDLLLSHSDKAVADMVGVKLSTLRSWMRTDAFVEALREREREQTLAAKRLARQAVINSAVKLCELTQNSSNAEAKVLLDVIKASGSLDQENEDPGALLADAIRQAHREEAADAQQL